MTDDAMRDLADDAVSIQANLEDLRNRLDPHLPNLNPVNRELVVHAMSLLYGAVVLTSEAAGLLDKAVRP